MSIHDAYRRTFISHAHADNTLCVRYADALRERGIDCWIDTANAQKGHALDEEIAKQLDARSAFILMVTASSNASRWVALELGNYTALWADRLTQQVDGMERLIVPVRLQDVAVPTKVRSFNWIDAVGQPFDQVVNQIVSALSVPANQPWSAPVYPANPFVPYPVQPQMLPQVQPIVQTTVQSGGWPPAQPANWSVAKPAGQTVSQKDAPSLMARQESGLLIVCVAAIAFILGFFILPIYGYSAGAIGSGSISAWNSGGLLWIAFICALATGGISGVRAARFLAKVPARTKGGNLALPIIIMGGIGTLDLLAVLIYLFSSSGTAFGISIGPSWGYWVLMAAFVAMLVGGILQINTKP